MAALESAVDAAKSTTKLFAVLGILVAIGMYLTDRQFIPDVDTLGGAIGVSFIIGVEVLVVVTMIVVVFLAFWFAEYRDDGRESD